MRLATKTDDIVQAIDKTEDILAGATKGSKGFSNLDEFDTLKGSKVVKTNASPSGMVDEVLEGRRGTKSLGKQTTAADWNGKTNELAKSAPIDIPENATVKIQTKTGYDQITYKWSDGTYKYEVRWHTKTPGAPSGQGNTWLIERTTPGTPTGQRAVTHILTGEGQWTTRYDWQQAIKAFQNGTATEAQKTLLENGHWPGL